MLKRIVINSMNKKRIQYDRKQFLLNTAILYEACLYLYLTVWCKTL